MVTAIFLLLHILFALLVFFLVIAFVAGAPFVPSTNPTARVMIYLARIKPGMNVYDLGSGDGKLLFLAAEKGATAIGLEINPLLVLWTLFKKTLSPHRNHIIVLWRNFWTTDLSCADVVFIYLLPWRMEQLKNKLQKELKPGSLVVSNSFIFPDWNILRQDQKTHVCVFRV
ncbi:hypothetical protein HY950_02935 [Candidatus Gottesmanbacteria bacterium]|nr:hypothetical protein [Candidatus Gottesmanbacteria bacterium]